MCEYVQVMPQTLAAVKTILEFSLPCVVAVTKADTHPDPESRKAAISQQLLEAGLVTEEFGGDVPVRRTAFAAECGRAGDPHVTFIAGCSYFCQDWSWAARVERRPVAPSGSESSPNRFSLPVLVPASLPLRLHVQVLEPKAAFSVPGEAVVVESTTVKGLGNVADCVVRWGTLKQGDYFVVGNTVSVLLMRFTPFPDWSQGMLQRNFQYGKVKALLDSSGGRIKEVSRSVFLW
jgi:hypothetical protein